MPTIKFSLNDEYYQKLQEMAQQDGVSVQECIRNRLFNLKIIFTPAEAVDRAIEKYADGHNLLLFLSCMEKNAQ